MAQLMGQRGGAPGSAPANPEEAAAQEEQRQAAEEQRRAMLVNLMQPAARDRRECGWQQLAGFPGAGQAPGQEGATLACLPPRPEVPRSLAQPRSHAPLGSGSTGRY